MVAGRPMAVDADPLPVNELEAIELWIVKGAPKWGPVGDSRTGRSVDGLLRASCASPRMHGYK